MGLASKRLRTAAVLAGAAAATLAAAITPAAATVHVPPRSALITVTAPIKAAKVMDTITLRAHIGDIPGTTQGWFTLYAGQQPQVTYAGTPVAGSPGDYELQWDTTAWTHPTVTIDADAADSNGIVIATSKVRVTVKLVNPVMSGATTATNNKSARFAAKYLPLAQTAHLYQCWAPVASAADVSANCDTAGVVDQPYTKTSITVAIKMKLGAAPHLTNTVAITVTSGGSTVVVLSRPVAVKP